MWVWNTVIVFDFKWCGDRLISWMDNLSLDQIPAPLSPRCDDGLLPDENIRNWGNAQIMIPLLSESPSKYRVSQKNARLRLEANNSSLEAAIGTYKTIFGYLRFSAFIWAQEFQDLVHGTWRKSHFKRHTLTWKQALNVECNTLKMWFSQSSMYKILDF